MARDAGETTYHSTPAYLMLFLTVLASRLFLIVAYGNPLPFADEWDAGAGALYAPYAAGRLSLEQLLGPHNEHRFLTSRLLGLVTYELAGGWLPRFQMVVNAAIFAGFGVWLVTTLAPLTDRAARPTLILVTALAFSLPLDIEVSLMGMNAHFYLVIIFSLAALRQLTKSEALSPSWWLGIGWSVLGYLSMSSACVTTAVALIAAVMQMVAGVRVANVRNLAGLVILAAVTAVMQSFVPTIPGHDIYRAHSIGQFFAALMAIAAVPLITPIGVAFVHWPLVFHVVETMRRRVALSAVEWFGVAMAGWIAANMMLVALSRATAPLSPRYLDLVVVAVPLSCAVLLRLAPLNRRWHAAAALWLFVIVFSASGLSYISTLRIAADMDRRLDTERPMIDGFLATGDQALLANATLSYPNADRLAAVLSDPDVRRILPADIRLAGEPGPDGDRMLLRGMLGSTVEGLLTYLPVAAILSASLAAGCLVLTLLGTAVAPARREFPPSA